jgi:hypothetical protein
MRVQLLAGLAGVFLAAPQYRADQLNCTRFSESSESSILTQTASGDREQTSGRQGIWRFRTTVDAGTLVVEGWLESLELWRRSPEATIRPDTDGLLGGRYRGALSPDGTYSNRARPFIPDEVAEVANMATALDDFFPPLPPRLLHVGEVWKGPSGVTIQRMADSALSGVPLYRFELQVRRDTESTEAEGDSLSITLHQVIQERGTFVWHPLAGLMGRERRIVVETTVPAGGAVRQAIRSRIQQRISVVRDLSVPARAAGSCPELSPQTGAGSPPT